MAAIDGISSVSNATAASYQAKPAPQVNSVEAVTDSVTGNAGVVATQVKTVKETDQDGKNDQSGNGSQERQEATSEQVKKAVETLNKQMNKNTSCQFGVHEETNRVTIKIIDNETKEVVKEFPPEETLDMIAKVWEIAGIMVDEKL